MFILSFIIVMLCSPLEWKQICAGLLLFVYICIVDGNQIIKGKAWNPIYRLNTFAFVCLS